MRELRYASVRYCTHLEHNVIMEGRINDKEGFKLECLNKDDCGYREEGCRNRLLSHSAEKAKNRSVEVG